MRSKAAAVAAFILLWGRSVAAATEARFTLGLTGEALSARTEVAGVETERRSLGGAITLGLDGSLLDRRVFSFGGFLRYSTFDLTEAGFARVISGYDVKSYGGSVRAFSNRPLSLSARVLHAVSTPTGEGPGASVGGTQDARGADATFRLKGLPELSYSYEDSRFVADEPQALRDESRKTHLARALAAYGAFRAAIEARKEDVDFYGGAVREALRSGLLNLDVNRGGANSLETIVNANEIRLAFGGSQLSEPTTVLFTRNTFRHRFGPVSYVDLVYSRQSSEDPEKRLTADMGIAAAYLSLSESVLLESRLAYVSQHDNLSASGNRFSQPSASVGIRWNRSLAGWALNASPRVSYVASSSSDRELESGLGGEVYLSAQRAWGSGSSFLVDADALHKEISIAPTQQGGSPVDPGFLSGLERDRLRGRIVWNQALSRRARLFAQVDASRIVRFVSGRDMTESGYSGNVGFTWATFTSRIAVSHATQTDAVFPAKTTIVNGLATWKPLTWLQADATGSAERREVLGNEGRYTFVEGGLRVLYARLSFFVRARESWVSGTGGAEWRDRRYWAGIQRTFDIPLLSGSRNGSRAGSGAGRFGGRGQR